MNTPATCLAPAGSSTDAGHEGVAKIEVITSTRQQSHSAGRHSGRGANLSNLMQLTHAKRAHQWNIPTLLNANARSLSTEKMDELFAVVSNNSVSIICITETWFKGYVPTESVSIPGFNCERRDRSDRRGGGVACFIKDTMLYDRLLDLNNDLHEVLWVKLRPHKLPRKFSCIVVGCVYHPPEADDASMQEYLINCVDNIFRKHPDSGIVLMGDFNRLRDNFLKTHYGFKQIVTCATRGVALLDKIWTNMSTVYDRPVTLSKLGSSDHNMVLVLPTDHSPLCTGSIQRTKIRLSGFKQKIHFADELLKVRWEPLYRFETCEEQFAYYQEIMERLMTDCFPSKFVTRHSADKPWVTDAFRQLVRQRQRAHMSGNRPATNRLRNQVNREAKRLRHQFYQSKIRALEDSTSRDWWKHMKSLMGLSNDGKTELTSLANRCTDGDISVLTNRVNDFLVSVSSNLPRLSKNHRIFQIQDPLPSAFTVTVADTRDALSKVKMNKATGPDLVPAWVLRDFSHVLAPPLTAIFNSSLREGILPDLWKTATIIALPKKHPPTSIEKDLRPISLTPIISKVFESIVLKWVDPVMSPQLDRRQFGSIQGTSTTDILVEMVHTWYKETDSPGNFIRILLLDYSKAFDLINHDLLIEKLIKFNIPNHVVRWMAAFLLDRHHRVRIGSYMSNWGSPNGGVPQGTLSGPKDFLAHINDLTTPCPIYKYVDDSTIFEVCAPESVSRLQESAEIVHQWSTNNDMKINTSKTVEMVIDFSRGKVLTAALPNIIMDGIGIQRTNCAKVLGVHISSDLTWNEHVDHMVSKASKRLYMLYQLKRAGVTQGDLLKIYLSVVRPVLEYACPVWSTNLPKYLSNKIEMIQKRALKAIYPGLSYEIALDNVGMTSLYVRRTVICRNYFNAMKTKNHKLNHMLPEPRVVQYHLRTRTQLPPINCRTSRFQNSFLPWVLSNCQ